MLQDLFYKMLCLFSFVILTVCALPIMAYGQELVIVPPTPTDTVPWWMHMLIAASGIVGAFILNWVRKYFGHLMNLAAEKTNLAFLSRIDDLVMNKVSDLWQSEIKALKAAAKDGKLTKEEKAQFTKIAVDGLKSLLDFKLLTGLFGDQIDGALGSIVEKHVVQAKLSHKAVAAANPSTP